LRIIIIIIIIEAASVRFDASITSEVTWFTRFVRIKD